MFSIISGHQCPAYRNVFQVHSALTTDRRREAACAVALRRRAAHFTVCWACSVFTRRKGHDIISHTHTHTHTQTQRASRHLARPAGRPSCGNVRLESVRVSHLAAPLSSLHSAHPPPPSSQKTNLLHCAFKKYTTQPPTIIGPIPWGHSGPLCHALSLSSWTSMRRRRATVPLATPGEWA